MRRLEPHLPGHRRPGRPHRLDDNRTRCRRKTHRRRIDPDRGPAECLLRRLGDVLDVRRRHHFERLERSHRDLEVRARQAAAQFRHRAQPGERVLRRDRGGEVGRDRGRLDAAAPAAGQVQLALHLDVAARRLLRVALAHPVEQVLVQLAQRDPAVLVAVGLARAQALHQRGGEHRRLRDPAFGQPGAFEGVLDGVRRRDHRAAAAAAEAVQDVRVPRRAHRDTLAERAAVTAVQQQHDTARTALLQALLDEVRGHRRRAEPVRAGVAGGEEQLAGVVLQAVAGKVQQEDVVGTALGAEVLDLRLHHVRGFVAHHPDFEVADRAVGQHTGEGVRVRRG